MLLFVLFVLVPVVQAARYGFYKWNGLGSLDDYIGLKNYQTLFKDPIFLQAVKNSPKGAQELVTFPLLGGLPMQLLDRGLDFFRTPYLIAKRPALPWIAHFGP